MSFTLCSYESLTFFVGFKFGGRSSLVVMVAKAYVAWKTFSREGTILCRRPVKVNMYNSSIGEVGKLLLTIQEHTHSNQILNLEIRARKWVNSHYMHCIVM